MKIPCTKECPDRVPNCHGKCHAYMKYWEEHQKELKQHILKSDVDDYMFKAIHRSKTSTREGREKYG